MSSSAPKVESLGGGRSQGRTLLFRHGVDSTNPDDAFACILWECDAGKGEAIVNVAVETQPASKLFVGERLARTLIDAIRWAEGELVDAPRRLVQASMAEASRSWAEQEANR